MAVTVSVQLEG